MRFISSSYSDEDDQVYSKTIFTSDVALRDLLSLKNN